MEEAVIVLRIHLAEGGDLTIEPSETLLNLAREIGRVLPVKSTLRVESPANDVRIGFYFMRHARTLQEMLSPMKLTVQQIGYGGTCDVILPYTFEQLQQAITLLESVVVKVV
jgi:hypothetical protein